MRALFQSVVVLSIVMPISMQALAGHLTTLYPIRSEIERHDLVIEGTVMGVASVNGTEINGIGKTDYIQRFLYDIKVSDVIKGRATGGQRITVHDTHSTLNLRIGHTTVLFLTKNKKGEFVLQHKFLDPRTYDTRYAQLLKKIAGEEFVDKSPRVRLTAKAGAFKNGEQTILLTFSLLEGQAVKLDPFVSLHIKRIGRKEHWSRVVMPDSKTAVIKLEKSKPFETTVSLNGLKAAMKDGELEITYIKGFTLWDIHELLEEEVPDRLLVRTRGRS
jgi:hypothetical protein